MATMFQRFAGSTVIVALTSMAMLVPAAPVHANHDQKYDIRCSASGWGEQFCSAPNRKVKLVEDYSGRCDKNETWRYDDRGIYVRGGCAGRFRVTGLGYGDAGYDGDPGPYGKNKDNTGTIVGAALLGAGLLWLISQSGKKKKDGSADQRKYGDWVDPDSRREDQDGVANKLALLSPEERRAFDACDAKVVDDVRTRGGRRVDLQELLNVAPGGLTDRYYVTANYNADFGSKSVTRKVECQVTGGQVTQYRLS